MQLFPEKIRKFWNGWEIRILVLSSLILQILLTIFGSRRKYTARTWIKILVWSAYLTADWVATVVLGNLATSDGDSEDNSHRSGNEIHSFWAPFLLLHLGGPDTITAYSLEDNELWLRHFLALVVQIGVTFYVFLRFWSNSAFTFMAIPIFIVGVIKYGEKTFVLRFSSNENFKDSLLSDPKPGPEIVKLLKGNIMENLQEEDSHLLVQAYFLLKRLALFFAGQILDYNEEATSYRIFEEKSAEDAFNLVAVELGFMYDLLYTKANIVYSGFGILVRCFSLFTSTIVLFLFSFTTSFHAYPAIDISITYLLLLGAVALEFYSSILHFFSDWTKLCFTKGADKLLSISILFENYHYLCWKDVNVALQGLIFSELMDKIEKHKEHHPFSLNATGHKLRAQRGDYVLEERYNMHPDMLWFTASEVFCPSMMPKGFADSRYRHTCEEPVNFFESKKNEISNKNSSEVRQVLLEKELERSTVSNRVNSHPSVFLSGCWLGKQLQLLESKDDWDYEKKWKMISEVWVEILAHTACHCQWNAHGQYLRNGGELLTHVCLLMAHLGLSDQYRVFNSYFVA
ncbi:DUF594 family protein [Melia azedarach]|uniref:DUF594 family protein n=2 Tax=Melia azedarach TaxID=155640 RepID=A0ACC1Y248_MELAZ|nr:DUF594 family protein [Melia azedarach]KAJ4717267.1 DUF594 family protein [Melia azedarach]